MFWGVHVGVCANNLSGRHTFQPRLMLACICHFVHKYEENLRETHLDVPDGEVLYRETIAASAVAKIVTHKSAGGGRW